MPKASCGRWLLKISIKSSNLACCCRKFAAAGLVVSFFKVRCIRSWRPFCLGWPGRIRSIPIPRRSHQTASLLKLKRAWAEAKGTPRSLRMLAGRPRSLNSRSKTVKGEVFAGRGQRLAGEQITAGMIGHGQWVAVVMIAQQELALVIRTPQLIGTLAGDKAVPCA